MSVRPQAPRDPTGSPLDSAARRNLGEAFADLGLAEPRPVLVLVGGADSLAPEIQDGLLPPFERLVPQLDRLGAAVIDGGTDSGVMALMGRARRSQRGSFPLIGVVAQGTVSLDALPPLARRLPGGESLHPLSAGQRASLARDHTHFLLVSGNRWGDESSWISAAADLLAGDRPSLTLAAGGGRITRIDLAMGLAAGRPLILLAGTGGTTDLFADGCRGGEIPEMPAGLDTRSLIRVLRLVDADERLPEMVGAILGV